MRSRRGSCRPRPTGVRLAALALPAALALLAPGCAAPDPAEAEGARLAEDGVFRYVDFPGVAPDAAFEAVRSRVRFEFPRTAIFEDEAERRVEVEPFALPGPEGRRLSFFARVLPIEGGSRVEFLAHLDRIRDDLEDHPEQPWVSDGRYSEFEAWFVRALRRELIVAPSVEGEAPAPTTDD